MIQRNNMKFRKKPVVIEAVEWDGNLTTLDELGSFSRSVSQNPESKELQIETLEGEMTARIGDWVIKGVAGEIYPCKPDIFEKTYERVTE